MILKNMQLTQLYESLCKVRDDDTLHIPVRTGYKILKNIAMLEDSYVAIEQLRQKIVRQYGEPTENPGEYRIPQEKMEYASIELKELSEIDNNYHLETINLSELEDLSIPLSTLDSLFLIIDGEK